MDIATCMKYLQFVSGECNRCLTHSSVRDEALGQLIIEFTRFQEKVKLSELPEELKSKVSDIKLNYSASSVARGDWYFFAAFLTFGVSAGILSWKIQSARKKALQTLKIETEQLATFIRLTY